MDEDSGPQLHLPTAPARPGERPDFTYLTVTCAGAAPRPPIDAPAHAIRDLAFDLIRVLDEDGRAVGPWAAALDPTVLLRGLRAMMLTRLFDERMFRAQRQGKTTFFISSTGEEAIGAAQSQALIPGDMCFPSYRMTSFLLERDYPLETLFNHNFGNSADPLQGRQLPILYSARDFGFYSLSGNVGSRFGHAVGWAMAAAYRGEPFVALSLIGEGATAEGDFHAALTFAAVYRAPAILTVVNNQWAISSFQTVAGGQETTFAARGLGYGLPALRADGNDFLAVHAATSWAGERARAGLGATVIELVTYRAGAHSTSDDPGKYRPNDDASNWPLGDPVERLKGHLIAIGEWSDERHEQMLAELTEEVRSVAKAAEALGVHGTSKPSVKRMFEHVYKDEDWRLREQRQELGV
jgi:2-oxoisovalerate dehydrogenase E1 component alpha subunit